MIDFKSRGYPEITDEARKQGGVIMHGNTIDSELSELAYSYTQNILKTHGNKISSKQEVELIKVLESATRIISLQDNKRMASPLPCGAGKTTAIRAMIKATYDLKRDHRIVVCAEKIEALCELLRDLTDQDGIPRDNITLIHTYDHDPDFNLEAPKQKTASEKADEWKGEHRQFLLLTHSKLQHGSGRLEYDLLFYDETLLLGESSAISVPDLAGEIGKFINKVEASKSLAKDNQRNLLPWLKSTKIELMKDRPIQGEFILEIDPLPMDIKDAKAAGKPIHGNDPMLSNFMGMVYDKAEIRLLEGCNQGSALVTYRQVIPDDLSNMIILDASYNIRKLTTYDDRVDVISLSGDIKEHSSVTAYVHKAKAGRQSIIGGLQRGKELPLLDEISALAARKLNDGKKVLIFTFKDDGKGRPVSVLKEKITDELGKDPVMLSNGGELRFLTWGYETAINSHSDCDTVMFAGLLTLPTAEVAGRVFAQSTDIRLQISSDELNEVVQSEKVHSTYQALNRGSCRIMRDGKANPMEAYIFTHDYLAMKSALKIVMPGIRFKRYKASYLKEGTSKIEQCKDNIFDYLESFKGDKISKSSLFKDCLYDFKVDTRGKALKELLDDVLSFKWESSGRSINRIT